MSNRPQMLRTFAAQLDVKAPERILSGIAAPFNEITDATEWGREQIAPGAFTRTIAERGPSRVKVLLNHNAQQLPVGRAISLTETSQGLMVELAISETPDGDTALRLVRDSVLDGLSIGFQIVNDHVDRDGVRVLTEIKLHEISLTPFPAYDNARVVSVRSAQESTHIHAASVLAIAGASLATFHERTAQMSTTDEALELNLKLEQDEHHALKCRLQQAMKNNETERVESLTRLLEESTIRVEDFTQELERSSKPTSDSRPAYDQVARVGQESRTYVDRSQRANAGADFITDLFRSQILHDPQASERLARHGQEVQVDTPDLHQRAVTSGGAGAFVPPQYLVDSWGEYARAGRPVANLVTKVPLPPEGMVLNIPKVTTPTQVGVQTTEIDTIDTADIDETTIPVPVRTLAGYVDVSRQAIERGQIFESVIMSDLAADYARRLDYQIIAGDGESGAHTGLLSTSSINAITYTDGSPTLAELWPKLASAVGSVISQRFTGPSAVVLHPNTWAWMLSVLDDSKRPFIVPAGNGPANSVGTMNAPSYDGVAGSLLGLPVILDGNIPTNLGGGTNETRIIIADFRDALLLEEPNPVQLRFDDVGSNVLAARLLIYGYSAFTAARQPKAVSVIAGTGLVTPSL